MLNFIRRILGRRNQGPIKMTAPTVLVARCGLVLSQNDAMRWDPSAIVTYPTAAPLPFEPMRRRGAVLSDQPAAFDQTARAPLDVLIWEDQHRGPILEDDQAFFMR
jgi:hypothetical protein